MPKKLTTDKSTEDFKKAYSAKKKLIDRQKDDFLFRLGKQWDAEKEEKLRQAGINPVVDNRIQPNIFLITGLERQNRSDFKAYPEGEEDSLKAEIASILFKDSIKKSDFQYKASEAFEDAVTCGESALELYLDNTYNLLNGKPMWKKIDSNMVFPEPGSREYDHSDARYIYKLTTDLSKDDLIALFPEKKSKINNAKGGTLDIKALTSDSELHLQKKDYPKRGGESGYMKEEGQFDLLERYYKKWVEKVFIGDKKTGEIKESESSETAEQFISEYQAKVQFERNEYEQAKNASQIPVLDELGQPVQASPVPEIPQEDPGRFVLIKRSVPEIWYHACAPGVEDELADELAWFYPKWKGWPIIPCYAHFSTAPIEGDDKHLLVQGVVYSVKGVQQKHNSSETIKLMHLNSAQNSGWITEEDSWVDPTKVANFGSTPGANLEYKSGKPKPERVFPMPISQGHTQIAQESAEAIKQILGINADLLAAQDGGQSSGRAIALRQRQGLLMVQKLFDNLSRTKQLCGKFLLTQLGEIYDTETAKKILGEAFLTKNFPPPMEFVEDPITGQPQINPQTGQPIQEPMKDEFGNPMQYDKEIADLQIVEVLSGDLEQYDVSVGESVASETIKLANSAEIQEMAAKMPGLIPPEVLIEESQISQSAKTKILNAVRAAKVLPTQIPPLQIAQ